MGWKCPGCGAHNYEAGECWSCTPTGLDDRDHFSWRQVYAECEVRGYRP